MNSATKESSQSNSSRGEHHAVHNFNAGPSILPKEVFEEASRAIIDYNGTGLSILEIGHRTKLFGAVIEEAISALKELMQIKGLEQYYLYYASAGEMYFELNKKLEAKSYFEKALRLTTSLSEQQLLLEKISQCN